MPPPPAQLAAVTQGRSDLQAKVTAARAECNDLQTKVATMTLERGRAVADHAQAQQGLAQVQAQLTQAQSKLNDANTAAAGAMSKLASTEQERERELLASASE